MGQFVDLTSADGFTVPAWVAMPEGTPRGGVVVLQEVFGVNSHIRSVAERWAAQGYAAVAPALFARLKPDVELGYSAQDMEDGIALKAQAEALPGAGVLPDIQAAIGHAAQLGGGKVGIVGFCWGGLLAWRAACELQGLSAALCYYGGGMTMGEEVKRQPRCPVLAHFGRRDHFITLDSVEAFGRVHPEVEIHLYDADHGFNCDQRSSYEATAAATAAERSQDFLSRHLR